MTEDPTPEAPAPDPAPTIFLTTLYGSKLGYRGPGVLAGMVEIVTDDGIKTSVLVADLRPESAVLIPRADRTDDGRADN